MAVIHYQFEADSSVADGNGRTARIINILYLIQKSCSTCPFSI
jgi:Fic family protein